VWSRTRAHAERFAEEVGARAMTAEDAVRGADVVVTATATKAPILEGAWLKPGAHVNAIGWGGYTSRELDDAAMANVVVVESREAALDQCGDVILSRAEIYAELGEILAGAKAAPTAQTTVFDSVGIAVEDLAAARLVYEAALGKKA
jgi:ornithine cyclodeaminase/alanine dehydrogenase-like protein (mu-crystallin family)